MIIGIDVGGTHTDGVILNNGHISKKIKRPTTKQNLYDSVIKTLDLLIEDIDPKKIERTVLSTTLTTNAIVEKSTKKTAVIVSAGPGIDPNNFKIGDYFKVVKGGLDHRGREIEKIDELEIRDCIKEIENQDISNIALISKFSPRNPVHENRKEEILKPYFSNIFKGHNFSGNLNFPRRINTTWLNSAVHDLYKNFFTSAKKSFEEKGIKSPIHILKADGGTMPLQESINFPAQTIFSGPAASVMGSIPHSKENIDTLILDIGGTTTDMAVLANKVPLLAQNGIEVANIKTMIRAIETESVGIGGDSLVELVNGDLKIGPERKGPAMAFGGKHPTPTDAFVFLNLMDNGSKEDAKKGMELISEKLNIDLNKTAELIIKKTAQNIVKSFENMVSKINNKPVYTLHEFLEGYQVKPKSILVLGGPAKVMAKKIEELSGIKTTPLKNAGVANAVGAAMAKPTCSITLFADTEQRIVNAPEENFSSKIPHNFSRDDAHEKAKELLLLKAKKMGADLSCVEVETIEDISFNMIRGYRSSGKNIRITLQVKPGLIKGEYNA